MSEYIPKFEDTEEVEESEYIPAFDDTEEIVQEEPGMMDYLAETGEGLARGAAQGLTFGFADEITAGLESALTDKTYEKALEESRAAYEMAEEESPIASLVGNIGGGLATMVVPGLGMVNAAKNAKLAELALKGAAGGGIAGAGISEEDTVSGVAGDAAQGAMFGAAIPAVGVGAAKIAKPIANALGGKKFVDAYKNKMFLKEKGLNGPTLGEDGAKHFAEVAGSDIRENVLPMYKKFLQNRIGTKNKIVDYAGQAKDDALDLFDVDKLENFAKQKVASGEFDSEFMEKQWPAIKQKLMAKRKVLGEELGYTPSQIEDISSQVDDYISGKMDDIDLGLDDKVKKLTKLEEEYNLTQKKNNNALQNLELQERQYQGKFDDLSEDFLQKDSQLNYPKENIGPDVSSDLDLRKIKRDPEKVKRFQEITQRKMDYLQERERLTQKLKDVKLKEAEMSAKEYQSNVNDILTSAKDAEMKYYGEMQNLYSAGQKYIEELPRYSPPTAPSFRFLENQRASMAREALEQGVNKDVGDVYREFGKGITDYLNSNVMKAVDGEDELARLARENLMAQTGGQTLQDVNQGISGSIANLKQLGLAKNTRDLSDPGNVQKLVDRVGRDILAEGKDTSSALLGSEKRGVLFSELQKAFPEQLQTSSQGLISKAARDIPGDFERYGSMADIADLTRGRANDLLSLRTLDQLAAAGGAALGEMTPVQLTGFANKVIEKTGNSPTGQKLGEVLSNMGAMDKNKRIATMFGLMQNPEYRKIIKDD